MSIALRLLRWIGIVLLAVALFLYGMRFVDGPLGPVAGGPFTTGTMYVGDEPGWEDMRTRSEVQFQLLNPASSRTSWILLYDGRLFIPSGYMNTLVGKIWKQWPAKAVADGRALLRVDGTIYPRTLVRLRAGPDLDPVLRQLGEKYVRPLAADDKGGPVSDDQILKNLRADIASGNLWLFELRPRPPANPT